MGGESYRVQEIMEAEFAGWTADKVSAASAMTVTVYTGRCTLAWLRVLTGAITVIPKDNATALFDEVTSAADLNLSFCPLKVGTSIKLTFSGAGTVWVIHRARV